MNITGNIHGFLTISKYKYFFAPPSMIFLICSKTFHNENIIVIVFAATLQKKWVGKM
jgi:hypothetical protein